MNGPRRGDRGQRGLTLVELMIGMVLTSLLVGMVFTLFIQMSLAFRTQSQVSELQQQLVSAQTMVARDLRQAGYQLPNGYTVAYDASYHQALEIINASDGPDELHVAYGDPSAQARVEAFVGTAMITVDDIDRFATGDLIVITVPRVVPSTVSPVPPQEFVACVAKIGDLAGTEITLTTDGPWGSASNVHCQNVANLTIAGASTTMVYRFITRGYRIDPDRKDLSVLQRSDSGAVEDDWQDLAIGFTDLQVATRWFDDDGFDTADPDDDPAWDWYAGDAQTQLTAPLDAPPRLFPSQITISFVVRSTRKVDGVVSDSTPLLIGAGDADHNAVGDRAAVPLAGVADASRPEELRGDHVYRWSTTRVDLRNLGVGL